MRGGLQHDANKKPYIKRLSGAYNYNASGQTQTYVHQCGYVAARIDSLPEKSP